MLIILNDEPVNVPETRISVRELMESRNVPLIGSAVAVNDRLVQRSKWETAYIEDGDSVTVISAAFGG